MRQAFVERHRDIRSEPGLNVDGLLRRQKMRGAVEMRSKLHAVLGDRAPGGEAEHLIAATVGEDGPRPSDERVKAAAPSDQVVAWPQVEVIRVAQENVGAELFEILVEDALDGALRAHRHEGRRLNLA